MQRRFFSLSVIAPLALALVSCGGDYSQPTKTSFRTTDGDKRQIYVTVSYELMGQSTTQMALDDLVSNANARILADAEARAGNISAKLNDIDSLKSELKEGLAKSLNSATQNNPNFSATVTNVSVVDLIGTCNQNLALNPDVPEGVVCASDSDAPGTPGYLRATVQFKDNERSQQYPFDVYTFLDVDMVNANAAPKIHQAKTNQQLAQITAYEQANKPVIVAPYSGQAIPQAPVQ